MCGDLRAKAIASLYLCHRNFLLGDAAAPAYSQPSCLGKITGRLHRADVLPSSLADAAVSAQSFQLTEQKELVTTRTHTYEATLGIDGSTASNRVQDASQSSAASSTRGWGRRQPRRFRPGSRLRKTVESHPPAEIAELALYQLREAIRENRVSFPSQVPAFVTGKQRWRDLQWKLVCLYFVRGWSLVELSRRYGLNRGHVWQILTEWQRRAASAGYVQFIPSIESLPQAEAGFYESTLVPAVPCPSPLNGNSVRTQAKTLAVGIHACSQPAQQQDERIQGIGLDVLGHKLSDAVRS